MTATEISATAQHKNLQKASGSKNPMEKIPEYTSYTATDGTPFSLYCKTKSDMGDKTLKWCFKLAEKNVGPFYKANSMGWQPKIKQADLNKNWARYLVACDKDKNPVAYAMFRFDFDYQQSVLYCYEMQIEKTSQRKGLGKFMMSTLEQCAKIWEMEKVVLTILKNNPDGKSFFTSIGFQLDDSSPDSFENKDYEILSKSLL